MMDFIMVPCIVGIVTAGIYGLFELYARRKERLLMIEKLAEKLDRTSIDGKLVMPNLGLSKRTFSALKVGCLLVGIGLGVFIGLLLTLQLGLEKNYELKGTAYGASVLLFGGIGLLVAFIIEVRMNKHKKE
ncbi:MAG: DUF6249 domain-containing protein [Phocaeicola sp.]